MNDLTIWQKVITVIFGMFGAATLAGIMAFMFGLHRDLPSPPPEKPKDDNEEHPMFV